MWPITASRPGAAIRNRAPAVRFHMKSLDFKQMPLSVMLDYMREPFRKD